MKRRGSAGAPSGELGIVDAHELRASGLREQPIARSQLEAARYSAMPCDFVHRLLDPSLREATARAKRVRMSTQGKTQRRTPSRRAITVSTPEAPRASAGDSPSACGVWRARALPPPPVVQPGRHGSLPARIGDQPPGGHHRRAAQPPLRAKPQQQRIELPLPQIRMLAAPPPDLLHHLRGQRPPVDPVRPLRPPARPPVDRPPASGTASARSLPHIPSPPGSRAGARTPAPASDAVPLRSCRSTSLPGALLGAAVPARKTTSSDLLREDHPIMSRRAHTGRGSTGSSIERSRRSSGNSLISVLTSRRRGPRGAGPALRKAPRTGGIS